MTTYSFASRAATLLLGFACFLAAHTVPAQQLTAVPDHATGIYDVDEPVGWTISAPPQSIATEYTYVVRENNARVVQSGPLPLRSRRARIEVKLHEPGMLLVEIDADKPTSPPQAAAPDPGVAKKPAHAAVLGAAVAPTRLRPVVPRPADFASFWHGKLAELAAIPIHPVLTEVAGEYGGVHLYRVQLDSVGSHVRGYLAKPAAAGKFPALIVYQWAGVYKLDPQVAVSRAKNGWLVLNVDSHDLDPAAATGVPTDYYKLGDHDRNTSYFLNMYLRDTRAVDYIASLPEWDGKTIVLTGTSMGGQQSLVTAGLNPDRITAVSVNEPAGADTNADLHGRKAGYPYWNANDPAVMSTALYFDPVNFAPDIKAMTLMGVGFLDTTAPPAGLWTVYNQLTAPKEIVPMIDSAHNNLTPDKQENFLARERQFLDALLHGTAVQLKGINSSGAENSAPNPLP